MQSRRADTTLIYQGKDISNNISSDLISATYEEGFGRADTVNLQLQDRDDKWLLKWRPQVADTLSLSISVSNWIRPGDNRSLACGRFQIDELEYSAPPRVLNLGGSSMPSGSSFIGTPHSRTWKDVTLKDQFRSMLPKGMSLDWQAKFNLSLVYAEQSETADLEYISNQCEKYGLRPKVLNQRLVVFNALELDAAAPVRTFRRPDLAGYTFRQSATRTQYAACKVKYQCASKAQTITYTYPPNSTSKKVYEITEAVYSIAEAEAVAKAALWTQNMVSGIADITLIMGDTSLYAGRNIAIAGFGDFDGVYAVDSSTHDVSGSGYKTSLSLHKVIREAPEKEIAKGVSIGETINFSGGNHYVASTATAPTGGTRTAGTARITNMAAGAPHPYHLIGITSNVYGWVDASTVSKEGK